MLVAIWKLIMRDQLVLYPAIIGCYVNALLVQQMMLQAKASPLLVMYGFTVLCVSLFIQLIIVQIGLETAHGKIANFGQVLWLAVKRFFPVWSMLTILIIMMLGVYVLGTLHVLVRAVILVPLFFMAIIVQIYPIIYSLSGKSAVTTFLVLATFIRERFQLFVQLILFMILLTLTFVFFSTLLADISELPVAWKSMVLPVLQGVYMVVLNYAVIIMWLIKSKVQGVA